MVNNNKFKEGLIEGFIMSAGSITALCLVNGIPKLIGKIRDAVQNRRNDEPDEASDSDEVTEEIKENNDVSDNSK